MSSYPVLDNKPIDQWKVTELKEELKRRKLTTKGLKDDLIRRLDDSLRKEIESSKTNVDNGFDCASQPVVQSQDAITVPVVDEKTKDIMDKSDNRNEKLNYDTDQSNVNDDFCSLGKDQVLEETSIFGTVSAGLEPERVVEATIEETSVEVTNVETSVEVTTWETSVQVTTVESSPVHGESLVTEITLSGQELQNNETQNKNEDLNIQRQSEDSNPPHEKANLNPSDLDNQVFEVSKVTSDSISTDNVSINEKIELKDNIIADDVKLAFDVKPEVVEPSSTNVVLDDGNFQSMDVEEPLENKVTVEETDVDNSHTPDSAKKNDSGDVGSSEKLNLDRSSGDDSMEEDALESKQIESKSISDEVGDKREKAEVSMVREEEAPVDAIIDDLTADRKVENKNDLAVESVKRKLNGQEIVGNSETTKRQRRWNSEGLKVLDPEIANISPSTTRRDITPRTAKRNFSRSDSTASEETPKERVVPPSSKPPTSSLRIDRFLRPFTLKAVQELLGKTGTITNFWMDHIKTHCYVSYSSVEEAIETRNAVYNLQWPPNGGRLLLADFVEPQEVKMRVEDPASPATPVNTVPVPTPAPVSTQPQSTRLQVQRQVLPPPPPLSVSLPPPPPPPPPPLTNPPTTRERALPPPPPLPEKVDPPIVTLDDLFRKTRATPRIYYLPLSDEQVAAKQKAQVKTTKQ